MTAPAVPTTGLLNLEKELICFICTEVLYQPLTLIDCLHTFCGSCLKEWFSHQHRKASNSHNPNPLPYTCPTCRAAVKDAQHNAMINTLLDMFLTANPTRARPDDEKAEMAKVYKPGENILPRVDGRRRERRRRDHEDSEDRREHRGADEDRNRVRRGTDGTQVPRADELLSPSHAHTSSRSRSREHDHRRERRIQERHERRERRGVSTEGDRSTLDFNTESQSVASPPQSPPLSSPRHPDAVEARQRGARTVAHQASLRSLVSASDSGTGTGTGDSLDEARVMQEILAEGLLDGIDVEALTEAEQDELSEIIAQRYRELHPRRSQRTSPQTVPTSPQPTTDITTAMQSLRVDRDQRERRRSTNSRSQNESPRPSTRGSSTSRDARPPTSYTSTSDVGRPTTSSETHQAHRRRLSDQGSRPQIRGHRSTHPGVIPPPAARSATDLSTGSTADAPRRLSSDQRASTDPRHSPRQSPRASRAHQTASPPHVESPRHLSPTTTSDVLAIESASAAPAPRSVPQDGPAEVHGTSAHVRTQFEEPKIDCYRCGRTGIQYDVYKHCGPCAVDLCMRCFRSGRGCNHWFGFGYAAQVKFDASHPRRVSRSMELPHLLVGRQYRKPPPEATQSSGGGAMITTSDPAARLQEGHFCDHCGAFANSCFWSCDYCNDGEWGFCNDCVNTHHCCSHALLPIAHKLFAPGAGASHDYDPHVGSLNSALLEAHATFSRPLHSRSSPAHSAPSSVTSATDTASAGPLPDFVNLSITTHCDICATPIPPSDSRYHCPTHPSPTPTSPQRSGDYDICSGCYHNIVKIGRVTRDAGPAGWRKCSSGHRMIVTVFEAGSTDTGQRRVILNDLVGGLKMSEQDIAVWQQTLDSSSAPPSSFTAKGQWTWQDSADPADSNSASVATSGNRRTRSKKIALQPAGAREGKKPSRFPPDGGFGKVCRALWSYYPEEGEDGRGELLFPKGAVLTEVEEINDEWSDGVYAGERGFVPMVYVRDV